MVAVIDVGNHNIHLGLCQRGHVQLDEIYPCHERSLAQLTRRLRAKRVRGCALASVVPFITRSIKKAIKQSVNVRPIVVTYKTAPDILFSYKNPATLGADRIANIIGGLALYQRNVIVIDCGTAVTLDIGLQPNRHLGGVIIPGMYAAINGLITSTVLLKEVEVRRPRHLIGTSTKECMQSGVYYGTLLSIEQLLRAIKKEVNMKCMSVATGGWGRLVAQKCPSVDCYDRTLTLYGILKVYEHYVQ